MKILHIIDMKLTMKKYIVISSNYEGLFVDYFQAEKIGDVYRHFLKEWVDRYSEEYLDGSDPDDVLDDDQWDDMISYCRGEIHEWDDIEIREYSEPKFQTL